MENKSLISDRQITLFLGSIYIFIAAAALVIFIDPPFLQDMTESNREKEVNLTLREAISLSRSGNDQASLNLYRRALEEMPNSAAAHNNAGVSMMRLNLADEAFSAFTKALTMPHADSADIYNNLSVLALKMKDTVRAGEYFMKSDAANRYLINKLMNKGIYYLNRAVWDKSAESFLAALEIREDMRSYYKDMLIFSLYKYRKDEDKLAIINTLYETNSYDPEKYDTTLFLNSVRTDAIYAENENKAGFALARIGKYREALDHFNKSLAISPGYRDPKLNIQYILDNKLDQEVSPDTDD